MLPKIIDINNIKPADYNPRKIKPAQFVKLQESIKQLGCVIPVLVNTQNNIIIAGHQRVKAMQALGIKQVPVYFVKNVSKYDEARFNQFHNGIDIGEDGNGKAPIVKGFVEVDNTEFILKNSNASRVKSICRLLNRYGNVLSCVVNDGKIVYGGNYVKACQLLNITVNTYGLTGKQSANTLLHEDYGEFCYDNFKRQTYVQGLAQMNRLRGKQKFKSRLYEKLVIPYIRNNNISTLLDFGAGKAAYAKLLNASYLEFYQHRGDKLLVGNGNKMIDSLIKDIQANGRYQVVVCDSVINSTDSMQAEMAVLKCLNIFSQGDVFVSGRNMSFVQGLMNGKIDTSRTNRNVFIDSNGFTASFRKGHWYYQHFHTKKTFADEIKKAGFEIVQYVDSSSSFQAHIKKVRELSLEEAKEAIDFEFNLPLPNGNTYNRNKEVWEVVKRFY